MTQRAPVLAAMKRVHVAAGSSHLGHVEVSADRAAPDMAAARDMAAAPGAAAAPTRAAPVTEEATAATPGVANSTAATQASSRPRQWARGGPTSYQYGKSRYEIEYDSYFAGLTAEDDYDSDDD